MSKTFSSTKNVRVAEALVDFADRSDRGPAQLVRQPK